MQTPWGDLAVTDAHVHFFSRRFFRSARRRRRRLPQSRPRWAGTSPRRTPPNWPAPGPPSWTATASPRSVLIASMPGDEPSVLAAAAAVPGRFFAYAMVNPLAAGRRRARRGSMPSASSPPCTATPCTTRASTPVLEQAAAQNCAVFVHCGVLTVGVRKKLGLPSPFDMRFSNPDRPARGRAALSQSRASSCRTSAPAIFAKP